MAEQPSELKERTARMNTFLRFGRARHALVEAYKLRTYIQLKGARHEAEVQELERVERVISELEKQRTSGIQKLIKSVITMVKESLNPEVEDSRTLLDQFRLARRPIDDSDEAVQDEESQEECVEEKLPEVAATRQEGLGDQEVDWGWGPPTEGQ